MVSYLDADDEPDTFITFEPVYDDNQHTDHNKNLYKSENLLFDFKVLYRRSPEIDSDGDFDFDDSETLVVQQTHALDRDFFIGGDRSMMESIVCHILYTMEVPSYREIVHTLTIEMLDFKKSQAVFKVERIRVTLDVIVWRFPSEYDDGNADVKLAVAPARDEAMEKHLEAVVVEDNEGYYVICMDTIRVGSDVAGIRMPCLHVFHRTCVEKWLRSSEICPLCRTVFLSEP